MAISLQACTKWVAQTAPHRDVITKRREGRVRLTMQDGTAIQVLAPFVNGDSLFGYTRPTPERRQPYAVHMDAIRSVAVGRVNVVRTLLVVGAVGVVGFVILAALVGSSLSVSPGCSYSTCPP
jgi:hypothetical protein